MENKQVQIDFEELYKDKAFLEKVVSAENPDQVKALFLEKGLEFDDEAAKAFLETVRKGEDGELDESDLEAVSGGFALTLTTIGIAVACGAGAGLVAGVSAACLYKTFKDIEKKGKKCK